jgi:hypothetical protein
MSLGVGRNKLHDALDALDARWQETRKRWGDVVREDFEENYWAPVGPDVQAALRAMDRLTQVLARLRQDCG